MSNTKPTEVRGPLMWRESSIRMPLGTRITVCGYLSCDESTRVAHIVSAKGQYRLTTAFSADDEDGLLYATVEAAKLAAEDHFFAWMKRCGDMLSRFLPPRPPLFVCATLHAKQDGDYDLGVRLFRGQITESQALASLTSDVREKHPRAKRIGSVFFEAEV